MKPHADVSVVIPWRDLGDEHRRAAFEIVAAYWTETLPNAEIVVSSDAEPFTRAAALNAGVRRANGSVILHSDPDSLVSPVQAHAAVAMAERADGLVVAFSHYHYLTQEATAEVIQSGTDALAPDLACDDQGEGGVGNVTAYSRATWEAVGGYDESFGIWGGDDGAFAYSAEHLVAPLCRVPGPMFHLWHPRLPASVPGHPEYVRQMSILGRYRDASDAATIEALIAERGSHHKPS